MLTVPNKLGPGGPCQKLCPLVWAHASTPRHPRPLHRIVAGGNLVSQQLTQAPVASFSWKSSDWWGKALSGTTWCLLDHCLLPQSREGQGGSAGGGEDF